MNYKAEYGYMLKNGWQSSASNEVLLARALMLKNIRVFFDARDVVEVETPLLSQYSTTDPHLESLRSRFRDQVCYLNTSPEYAMKRLLAGWKKPIYQICKAFRDDELGPSHNPEFTMLEWYQPDYNVEKLMNQVAELVTCLSHVLKKSVVLSSERSVNQASSGVANVRFEFLSYQQVFVDSVGINPHQTTSAECCQAIKSNDIEIPRGLRLTDDVSDWLDWLLMQRILPAFKKDGFTFLYDYPAAQCALAKVAKNTQQVLVAKRFELFFGELELANGFCELTDANEQLQRFKQENKARKKARLDCGNIDENFMAALYSGLPECSGVAVGLDRLLMVLVKAAHVEQVMSFPWGRA